MPVRTEVASAVERIGRVLSTQLISFGVPLLGVDDVISKDGTLSEAMLHLKPAHAKSVLIALLEPMRELLSLNEEFKRSIGLVQFRSGSSSSSSSGTSTTDRDSFEVKTPLVATTSHLQKRLDDDGCKVINGYTIIDELGRGAYGKVKLAVDAANCPVAIKIVRKSQAKKLGGDAALAREIAVMKKLKHRNVVPLYEVINDPESDKLYMVMKYVDQGPIAKVNADNTCTPIAPEVAQEVMNELVDALVYVHKRRVAHRDIKPDNILLDAEGTPYFADFGVSSIIDKDDPTLNTVEGTALFMAPELFSESTLNVNAFAADVWGLGVTLYMLLYGVAPFKGTNYREIGAAVQQSLLVFPEVSSVPAMWQDLLRGMLNKDPAKRWTLRRIQNHKALQERQITQEDLRAALVPSVALPPVVTPLSAVVPEADAFAWSTASRNSEAPAVVTEEQVMVNSNIPFIRVSSTRADGAAESSAHPLQLVDAVATVNSDKVAAPAALGVSQTASPRLKSLSHFASFNGSTNSDKAAAFRPGGSVCMTPLCARRVLSRDHSGKGSIFRKQSLLPCEGSFGAVTGLVDFVPLRPSVKPYSEASRQGSLELSREAGANSRNPSIDAVPADAAREPPQAHLGSMRHSGRDHPLERLAPADGAQDPSLPTLSFFGSNVSAAGNAASATFSGESSSDHSNSPSLRSATTSFGSAAVMAPSPPRDQRPLHASPRAEAVLGDGNA
jgi:serine/threonine protein kinase